MYLLCPSSTAGPFVTQDPSSILGRLPHTVPFPLETVRGQFLQELLGADCGIFPLFQLPYERDAKKTLYLLFHILSLDMNQEGALPAAVPPITASVDRKCLSQAVHSQKPNPGLLGSWPPLQSSLHSFAQPPNVSGV